MVCETEFQFVTFALCMSLCCGMTVLSVEVGSSNIRNGETLELICNTSAIACCSGQREWYGGQGFKSLIRNGVSSNPLKYEETVQSSIFKLLIHASNKSDFGEDYQCRHDFDVSPMFNLLPLDFYTYVPDQTEIEYRSDVKNIKLSIDANITTVYPEPKCSATFGDISLTSQMVVTINNNGPFKAAQISITDAKYECPGSFAIKCTVNTYSFDVMSLDICSSLTDCKYWVCILTCLVLVIVYNGIITSVLIKKIPSNAPDKGNIAEMFVASVVILLIGSLEMFIITIIISACSEVCSCNKAAAIGFSVIPLLLVPLAYSIVILISLVCCNRPSKASITCALHVLCFGIGIYIQYIRTKNDAVNDKPINGKYNEVIITTEVDPPKRLLSCNLQNATSGKTKRFDIHYKRVSDMYYTKTSTLQIHAFELDTILDGNESYEIYITEIGTQWKSLTFTCEPMKDKHVAQSVDLETDCTLLKNLHSNKHISDVSWTHNGKPILTENNSIYKGGNIHHPSLTILSASDADSGKYVCTVTFRNDHEKEMETVTEVKKFRIDLTVSAEKEVKTIDLLRECTLLEKLHGDTHITDVQWTHNGMKILTENSCIYKGGDTKHPALTILLASNTDSGKYLCTITFTNETGKTEVKEYHVELTICDKKEAKSIDLLQDCTLLEKFHSNRHITGVLWTHADKPILTENSSFYKGGNANHPALTILYASNDDSGKYVCTVTFANEQKITEIKKYHVDLTVCDTKAVELLQECTLLEKLHRSDHIKRVYWTHKGNPIQTEISDIYNGGVKSHPALTLLYMSNTDFGEYACTVTFDSKNKAEETKKFITNLTVSGSLKLENLVKPGQNIQLLKELKGFTNLKTVQWHHNKQIIDIQKSCLYDGGITNSPALTISYASEDVSGEYVCTLVFHHQSDESHPGITKQFVTRLKVEPIAERNVTEGKEVTLIKTLKRNSKDENIYSVEWMHNTNKIEDNDSTYSGGDTTDPSLTIKSACLGDSGNYLCTLTFHKKAEDQSKRVEKRQFAVSLKVKEKKSKRKGVTSTENGTD